MQIPSRFLPPQLQIVQYYRMTYIASSEQIVSIAESDMKRIIVRGLQLMVVCPALVTAISTWKKTARLVLFKVPSSPERTLQVRVPSAKTHSIYLPVSVRPVVPDALRSKGQIHLTVNAY